MVHAQNSRPAAALPAHALRSRRADPPTPHPSWRHTLSGDEPGGADIRNADDFWKRLGV